VFLADSCEKDKKMLEVEKFKVDSELASLKKITSIAEQLSKVENKA